MSAEVWAYTIVSVVVVSLISFIGIFMLSLSQSFLKRILLFLVSFAIGALLGDALLHLLPEAIEEGIEPLLFGTYALIGVLAFFGIEKFLRWQHRHVFKHHEDVEHAHAHTKPFVWINLIGDGIHNFIDGMIIAGSYMVSIPLGFATTMAVVFHESAQEIGDFAVLIQGGLGRWKALFYNFLSAITAIIGGVLTLLIGTNISGLSEFLVPFTFAGFLYLALGTLVPELHHEDRLGQLVVQMLGMLIGVGIMAALLIAG